MKKTARVMAPSGAWPGSGVLVHAGPMNVRWLLNAVGRSLWALAIGRLPASTPCYFASETAHTEKVRPFF